MSKHKPMALTIETVDGPKSFCVGTEGIKQACEATRDYIKAKYGRPCRLERRIKERRA